MPTIAAFGLLSTAFAQVPAPMHGIWQLGALTLHGRSVQLAGTQLVISGDTVSGRLGCGTYQGHIAAGHGSAQVQVTPQPPRPNVRCLYALPGDFHSALNSVTSYVMSEDTQSLLLFSKRARLSFHRLGYITPAQK